MKSVLKTTLVIATAVILPLTLVACSKSESKSVSNHSDSNHTPIAASQTKANTPDKGKKKTEKYLVGRVTQIYQDVCDSYNAVNDDLSKLSELDLDDKYCSAEWLDLLKKIVAYDNKYHEGDMGFFDFDYWVMGQDFDNLSVHDVKVISMNDNEAVVGLTLVNMGEDIKLKLCMVYERDDWYIDNFENLSLDFEMKNSMKEYLKNPE